MLWAVEFALRLVGPDLNPHTPLGLLNRAALGGENAPHAAQRNTAAAHRRAMSLLNPKRAWEV